MNIKNDYKVYFIIINKMTPTISLSRKVSFLDFRDVIIIETYNNYNDIWWSEYELNTFRKDLIAQINNIYNISKLSITEIKQLLFIHN